MSSIKYRPEIDGLRAIAVIPVILFHLNNELLPGGFIGVDVFFVISGFLITSIILNEYERGLFSFFNFWSRRVIRILPVLIAMTLTTLLVGTIILYEPDINNLGSQGIATLLSFANISHWRLAGDYWGFAAESSPLLHTWTLSVEEQFYLFFPLLLVITLKYFHKWLGLIFIILSLLSVLLFLLGTQISPTATFYLLPTRAWELGVGAILAIFFFKKHLHFNKNSTLAVIGFLAIILSYFFIGGKGGISPFLIIPVFGAALIIAFAKDTNSIINKFLSATPVVYIGKISYSLYLWHWPILVYSRQLALKQNTEFNSIYVLILIFIVSVLSYHFIETPTRKNKKIIPYILFALLIGVVSSYALKISDLSKPSLYKKTEWDGNRYNVIFMTPLYEKISKSSKRMRDITISQDDSIGSDAYSSGGIKKLYGKKTPEIMVLGDSHALMWSRVLDEGAKELNTSISFYAADGTPTFFNIPTSKKVKGTMFLSAEEKYIFDNARLKFLMKWKPKIVVISTRWRNIDKQKVTDLIQYIGSIGSKILLIEQPPELFFGEKNAQLFFAYLGLTPSNNLKQYVQHVNDSKYQEGLNLVKKISEKYDYCETIPTSDIFLNNDKVWVIDSYYSLYIDDDHLSYAGALKAKDRILSALKKHL